MANYYEKTRSNLFRVRSVEIFQEIMSHCRGSEDPIELFYERKPSELNGIKCLQTEQYDKQPITRCGFCCDSAITGYFSIDPRENPEYYEEEYEGAFDAMLFNLQTVVAEDDAIVIHAIGWEKLRYLTSYMYMVTSKHIKSVSLADIVEQRVSKLLGRRFTIDL